MRVLILAAHLVAGSVGTPAIGGVSTWYDYHEGQAAAGPTLRELLGSDWRHSIVTVTGPDGSSVTVELTDWCLCTGGPTDRVIDLDRRDFAKLADPSVGVVAVTVAVLDVVLPATDGERSWWDWLNVVR